jgi:hypothetical protein
MYIGPHAKYPLFLSDFNQILIFERDKYIRKILKYRFYENPSSGGRFVSYERKDGQTDMTKLMATFGNFANAL